MRHARTLGAVLIAAMASLAALLGIGTTTAQAAASSCPLGDVCIYSGTTFAGSPVAKWSAYGPHNLSGMYGKHLVYNHQTGGATFALCTKYSGGSCGTYYPAGKYVVAYLTPINSVSIAETTAGPSSVGGTISKSEILRRMRYWYDARPSYSQSRYVYDIGGTRTYRTDCSGMADMALHLSGTEDVTGQFPTDSRFVKRYSLGSSTTRSHLNSANVQTGDVFDDVSDGHAFIFASWNSDGSFNYYNFGGGSTGTAPPEYHTHAHFSDSTLGYEPTSHYVIYRYTKVS